MSDDNLATELLHTLFKKHLETLQNIPKVNII